MQGPAASSDARAPVVQAYLEMRPNLVRVFAAKLRSREAAEDLVQEVYLRASQAAGQDVRDPRAWVFRIATNVMLDMQRSAARGKARDDQWAIDAAPTADSEPTPEQVVAARQRLSQVLAALEALPPRMREAFRLHRVEGATQAETAQRMGVSVKVVERHLAEAVQRLARAAPERIG